MHSVNCIIQYTVMILPEGMEEAPTFLTVTVVGVLRWYIAFMILTAEDNSEHPKVTYHLKIASSSELKKQPSKHTNMAKILKVSQSLKFLKFQDSVMDIVAHALELST